MYDIRIINALIPNFENDTFIETDLNIKNGKIVKIGSSNEEAKIEIDAKGKIVSPGFIDIHSHEEILDLKLEDPYYTANCALRMGATTIVGGNCGNNRQGFEVFHDYVSKKGSPVNYMMFLGHNFLRNAVGIEDRYRKATKDEIDRMKILVNENLKYNIVGLSYGIEYSPGVDMDEMVQIAGALDSDKYLLSAHYRYDGDRSVEAIEELVNLSKETSIPMQISHIGSCSAMGNMKESLEAVERAIKDNVNVLADCYPYAAFSTYLGSAVFDEGCFERWEKSYSDLLLTEEPYRGVRCTKELFYKVREEYPNMITAAFVMNEEEVEDALKSPYVMVGSDSLFNKSMGHPRGAGTFPRVLSRYVRENKTLTLIEALRKMTIMPAKRLNLDNKGEIFEGADADIVIFDKDIIEDKADYNDPTKAPVGIDYVIVNGEIALENNKIVKGRAGKYVDYKLI